MWPVVKFLVILCVALEADCQWLRWRRCPESVRAKRNFQSGEFLGVWYEHRRYASWFQTGQTCVKLTFSVSNSTAITVLQESRFANLIPVTLHGAGVYTDGPTIGSLGLGYPDGFEEPNFNVIDSDYTQYALAWQCRQRLGFSLQWLWLLTRDRFPDLEVVQRVVDRWSISGLRMEDMVVTEQLFCGLSH